MTGPRFEFPAKPGGVDLYVGGTGTPSCTLYALWLGLFGVDPSSAAGQPGPHPRRRRPEDVQSRENVARTMCAITAPSLRLYEIMGPLEATKPWSMTGVEGVSPSSPASGTHHGENRPAKTSAAVQDVPMDKARSSTRRSKKVGRHRDLSFNTAISQMMVCQHAIRRAATARRSAPFLRGAESICPAPRRSCGAGSGPGFADATWRATPRCSSRTNQTAHQVNGKVRDKITVKKEATREEVEALARGSAKIAE
jgi:leucyl-tRNA synthetase